MTPGEFIAKWRASELKERSAAQEHFIDLCRMLGEPTPADADPTGERYCFERGARKDGGGDGWADVWKRHHFAWEYKGKHADLAYWFVKAGGQIAAGKSDRVGLVATNSIRGGANRRALAAATSGRPIFDAWSDEPWVIDGAAVRVSLVCFAEEGARTPDPMLDGESVDAIHADLTALRGGVGVDLTAAKPLRENAGVAFMGDTKGGLFDVPGDLAGEWLRLPANPNGRPNADVLKPWANGMDITRRPAGKWIVDFGWEAREEPALYEAPYQHVREHVYPSRQRNRRELYRRYWWQHAEPRQGMWRALAGLCRYIATPRLAKHRLFVWMDAIVCPDSQLIVIVRDDDTTFGILHSRFHETWSLRQGTDLVDRPRYTPTTTFQTFPSHLACHPMSPPLNTRTNRVPSRSQGRPAASSRYATGGSTRPNGWTGLKRRPDSRSSRCRATTMPPVN